MISSIKFAIKKLSMAFVYPHGRIYLIFAILLYLFNGATITSAQTASSASSLLFDDALELNESAIEVQEFASNEMMVPEAERQRLKDRNFQQFKQQQMFPFIETNEDANPIVAENIVSVANGTTSQFVDTTKRPRSFNKGGPINYKGRRKSCRQFSLSFKGIEEDCKPKLDLLFLLDSSGPVEQIYKENVRWVLVILVFCEDRLLFFLRRIGTIFDEFLCF